MLGEPRSLGELLPRLNAGPGQPLLAVRLTRSPEGSILGVTLSHAVADGHGLFTFLRAWSRTVLGHAVAPIPWERRPLDVEPRAPAPVTPEQVWRSTGFTWRPGSRRAPAEQRPASLGARVVPPDPGQLAGDQPLSENDVLCAWLIKTYAHELAGPEGLAVTFPVDYRRCYSGLPATYFGNAIRGAPLWIQREHLERETVPELAARVQQAVRGVFDERGARDSLECIEQLRRERGLAALDEIHLADPRSGLLVTNVSGLPFGTLDFGGGPPVRTLLPAVEPRTAAIQQSDDGFEVSLLRVCE